MIEITTVSEEVWQRLKKRAELLGFITDERFSVIRWDRFGIVGYEQGNERKLVLSEYAIPGKKDLAPATQDEWDKAEKETLKLLGEVYSVRDRC